MPRGIGAAHCRQKLEVQHIYNEVKKKTGHEQDGLANGKRCGGGGDSPT